MSNDPRIIKEGGYQGTGDPGYPSMLMEPQFTPISKPAGPASPTPPADTSPPRA